MTHPTQGDTVEVRLLPYPGAEIQWKKAIVKSDPDEHGEFMLEFLNGYEYHGSRRMMVKRDDWREIDESAKPGGV